MTWFRELIDLPPAALAADQGCLPELRFVLDDLSQLSDEEARARGAPALASITLLLFKYGRQGECFRVRSFFRALGRGPLAQALTVRSGP